MTRLVITLPADAPGTKDVRLLLEPWPRLDTRPPARFWELTDNAVNAVEVPEPAADWFYFATLYRGEVVSSIRSITFSGEEVAWADATDVDPLTFQPADPAESVGQQLDELRAEIELRPIVRRVTDAEYDALTPEEKNDPGFLYVTPIPEPTP